MRETANGVMPSIWSFTSADMAMSGSPAGVSRTGIGGKEKTDMDDHTQTENCKRVMADLRMTARKPGLVPAKAPISMNTSGPQELIGPKARLWLKSDTRTWSCSSEQDSLSLPNHSTALLRVKQKKKTRNGTLVGLKKTENDIIHLPILHNNTGSLRT